MKADVPLSNKKWWEEDMVNHMVTCPHCKREQVGYYTVGAGSKPDPLADKLPYHRLCKVCNKEFIMFVPRETV